MRAFILLPAAVSLLGAAALAQKPDPTEEKAHAAYKNLQEKLKKAKSMKAILEVTMLGRTDSYSLSFLRDNFAKIVSSEAGLYQNGKTFYDYNPLDKEYWTKPAPAKGLPAGSAFSLGGLIGFDELGFSNEPRMVPTAMAPKTWKGLKASAIYLKGRQDPNMRAVLYLDAVSKLPVGWEYRLGEFQSSGRIKNLQLDVPMKASDFNWTPPAGAKQIG
jgi:outer membrane lipoprotein-sorting protein